MTSRLAAQSSEALADCHLHFEGSLPFEVVERLARRARHPFADRVVFEQRCRSVSDAAGFLSLYAEICRLFGSPEDYAQAAREVPQALAAGGVRYAEIYVSPEIFARIGLDPAACLAAVDEGLRDGQSAGGASCRILLDAVRHWGLESAERVLDLYERNPLPSIVGFGIGGDENASSAAVFGGVYLRARALGLKTSVHAGEWGGPESLREALDALRPDRIDHGIAAAADPELLERLAEEQTTLCIALCGNVATGAVSDFAAHPLPQLLEAGVRVALSADDPLLFATTTLSEYGVARERFGLGELRLRRLAENSWRAAFCSDRERQEGLAALAEFRLPQSPAGSEI
jgi:adenosine deaminase